MSRSQCPNYGEKGSEVGEDGLEETEDSGNNEWKKEHELTQDP